MKISKWVDRNNLVLTMQHCSEARIACYAALAAVSGQLLGQQKKDGNETPSNAFQLYDEGDFLTVVIRNGSKQQDLIEQVLEQIDVRDFPKFDAAPAKDQEKPTMPETLNKGAAADTDQQEKATSEETAEAVKESTASESQDVPNEWTYPTGTVVGEIDLSGLTPEGIIEKHGKKSLRLLCMLLQSGKLTDKQMFKTTFSKAAKLAHEKFMVISDPKAYVQKLNAKQKQDLMTTFWCFAKPSVVDFKEAPDDLCQRIRKGEFEGLDQTILDKVAINLITMMSGQKQKGEKA